MVLFPYTISEVVLLAAAGICRAVFLLLLFALPTHALADYRYVCYCLRGHAVEPWFRRLIQLRRFFRRLCLPLAVCLSCSCGAYRYLGSLSVACGNHWDLFFHYGGVIVITVAIFGRIERLRQRHAAAERRSADEIERLATSVERERIARDLHDILGHTLSSIVLKRFSQSATWQTAVRCRSAAATGAQRNSTAQLIAGASERVGL